MITSLWAGGWRRNNSKSPQRKLVHYSLSTLSNYILWNVHLRRAATVRVSSSQHCAILWELYVCFVLLVASCEPRRATATTKLEWSPDRRAHMLWAFGFIVPFTILKYNCYRSSYSGPYYFRSLQSSRRRTHNHGSLHAAVLLDTTCQFLLYNVGHTFGFVGYSFLPCHVVPYALF